VVVFFDTTVLIYSISRDPDEAEKRERAIALLERDDGALSIQVLQEFYTQATRATRPHRLPHEMAVDLITGWTRYPVQELNLPVLNDALRITLRYGFSYWDSAIVAAARALGCREVFTEDLSDGQQVENLVIVNPFR